MPIQPSREWSTAVDAVASAIASGRLGAGELAELRRLSPEDPAPPAFWHALIRLVEPRDPGPANADRRQAWEHQWAVILAGMAILDHRPDTSFGQALAETGYAEPRLRRLLRARGTRLWDEVRLGVRFLAAKGAAIRWQDCAGLVLADPETQPSWAEQVRRHIARDYFRVLYHREKGDQT
jgi:CRISPR system Cascade subunit CasB